MREIIAHAIEDDPIECCGIIAGRDSQATRLIRAKNAENSKFRFTVHPKELQQIYHDLDENDWDVLAIYHSHTGTKAYPSPTDIMFAGVWPDAHFLIISLANMTRPAVRSFTIKKGKVNPERIRVIEDSNVQESPTKSPSK